MSAFEEEMREDGHTILLMEPKEDNRTFSDYPNRHTCLETMVNMYEEENYAEQRQSTGLDDFWKWLDSFYQIMMLTYDREISRYRMIQRDGIKRLFEENPDGNGSYRPTENGHSEPGENMTNGITKTIVLNGLENTMGDSDDSDVDNWDE